MKNVPTKIDGIEFIVNGEIKVTSFEVAEHFGKEPKHVNEAISKLVKKDVPFFRPISIPDKYGRDRNGYTMNRDGYSLLVMGFTGKKALAFKLKFIDAFNKMEAYIIAEQERKRADDTARLECRPMTDALIEYRVSLGKATKPFHFSNEHNMVYKVALGATKKKWCDTFGIDKKDRFRDHLTSCQIRYVEEMQRANTMMLEM